jgi:hypothetical protein
MFYGLEPDIHIDIYPEPDFNPNIVSNEQTNTELIDPV